MAGTTERVGPYDIAFSNLHFTVTTKDGEDLDILKGITGFCTSGRLLSIMGASGAGKTTLLDILAFNMYGSGRTSGEVLVGGQPRQRSSFTRVSCYVMQRDILLASATVRECLLTSALLRLPMTMSRSDKEMQVENTLAELDLTSCANTMIGDELAGIKGVSGGQRRRVSVGIELVKDPHIIFLDEPTSGLDSETAGGLMKMLVLLARKQRTVVCTIHQPNSDITDEFDDFLLLAKGRTIYFGAWADSMDYFAELGHQCPQYKNPSDHYIALVSKPDVATALADNFSRREGKLVGIPTEVDVEAGSQNAEAGGNGRAVISDGPTVKAAPTVPFLQQARVLTVRYFRSFYRNPAQLVSELIQYAFLAVFTGLMYLQLDDSTVDGMFNRSASFWFILAISSFTPSFTTVTVWDRERLLLRRETVANMYNVTSYFVAKTLVVIPFEVAQTTVFCLVAYFMIGYQTSASKFFIFWVVLNIFQLISENIGSICAVAGRNATYGVILLTFTLLLLLSFSGFLVAVTPVYFRWVGQISYLTFAFAALLQNELDGLTLYNTDGTTVAGMDMFPDAVARLNKFPLGVNIAILGALYVITRVIALIILIIAARLRKI